MLNTAPTGEIFLEDVLTGLLRPSKELPCKYLYDRRGSELFDRICETEDYYPTRCELSIMQSSLSAISSCVGENASVVEYGAGSGMKTRLLINALSSPASFVPVDISEEYLADTARSLAREFPRLRIVPVCGDFTHPLELPIPDLGSGRRVIYFPGSTIGNFSPGQAETFLSETAAFCGRGGGLIVGVDLKKDRETLEAAYNDAEGVTAQFDLNILARINRELDGHFELGNFYHQACYNDREGCIEMHLVSRKRQHVRIQQFEVGLEAGESILTERSYKYTLAGFEELAAGAGFTRRALWTDSRGFFSVQYFVVE